MHNSESVKTRERILGAAVELFSKAGYHGTSSREIARAAEVNEVTIYRHFSCKRDLFVAALEAELSRISVRAELGARLASAPHAHAAMEYLFQAIEETAKGQPAMLRLIQFSALELEEDLKPIYSKHLGNLLDVSVSCLQRWVDLGQLQCKDPRLLVLAFAATVIGIDTFFPVLWRGDVRLPTSEAPRAYAQMLDSVLTPRV